MLRFKYFIAFSALAMLTSCGGGGSSGGGGGSGGTNETVSFSSPRTLSITESRGTSETRVLLDISASSSRGSGITYTIEPGKDSALFSFLATGRPASLILNNAVSFETPRDADRNNVYEIDVRASSATGASATQSILITVTNTSEGLVVRTLTTLSNAANARINHLPSTNELLVVSASGNIQRISAQTGAQIASAQMPLAAGGTVLDIAADNLAFRGGAFFVLAREGTLLSLLYVDAASGARRTLWSATLSADVVASLGMFGSDVLLAIGDAGDRNAAQNPADLRGNVIRMQTLGLFADPSSITVTPVTVGTGLRAPLFSPDREVRDWVMDRGERFNELNQPNFPPVSGLPNYEWPIRDGLVDGPGFSGTVTGGRATPRTVQEIGLNNAGRWIAAAESFQADGWRGVWIFADDRGNLWTWDRLADAPFELRNLDFGLTDVGPARSFVAMDQGNTATNGIAPIFMLRADGALLVAEVQP
ncbi:hypothetical protein [Erythrobacter oryzae]|uniref:hypothetical protein n=1 Tax=Erythrobacter oryzae TaxID=3019556 RepID=UPI002554994B|nr:hypothetical protein [Erythrobacter sp. COR-2]